MDLTINGFDLSVLVSDMRVEKTSGLIVKETNSYIEANAPLAIVSIGEI